MFTRTTKALIAAPVSAATAFVLAASLCLPVTQAHADELSDAQATLDNASAQLSSITKEYEALQTQLSSLDEQISSTTQKVQDAQTAMLEGREVLSDTILSQYRSDSALSLVNIFLSSQSISDFTKSLTYYTSIQEDQAEQIATQKELSEKFSSALEELDSQRDQQQELLDQAEAKKTQAEQVVADASSKVSQIQEKQAQLAALQQQAAALAQQEAQSSQNTTQESANWNTNTDRDAKANESETNNNSSSNNSSSNNTSNNSNSNTSPSAGWKTGVASAYGGSSDKGTPNPGTTATGAICNDTSMGVAIPMAWSNYRSYFGHAVEIKYGGKTVIATINDCGGMGGGSRSLDLQPGVFKAFGFSTCQAWGLRTVSYRIL